MPKMAKISFSMPSFESSAPLNLSQIGTVQKINSPKGWCQIGIRLGAKYVINQKLENFT